MGAQAAQDMLSLDEAARCLWVSEQSVLGYIEERKVRECLHGARELPPGIAHARPRHTGAKSEDAGSQVGIQSAQLALSIRGSLAGRPRTRAPGNGSKPAKAGFAVSGATLAGPWPLAGPSLSSLRHPAANFGA
jgi:hypothetical protein